MKIKAKLSYNINLDIGKEKVNEILFKSMLKTQELMKLKAPVYTSLLKDSIKLDPISPNYSEYIIFVTVDYAVDVEYGSEPKEVNFSDISTWAKRKLGDESKAKAIQEKIRQKGTNAQPYARPSLQEVKETHLKNIINKTFR